MPVWRDRDTLQIGIDPRRAIALSGMSGAAPLIALLDGSRDREQLIAAAAGQGVPPPTTERVLTILAAGGALDDFPAATLRELAPDVRTRLAPELATTSLAHRDGDGGARALARRRNAVIRIEGEPRVARAIARILIRAGVGQVEFIQPPDEQERPMPAYLRPAWPERERGRYIGMRSGPAAPLSGRGRPALPPGRARKTSAGSAPAPLAGPGLDARDAPGQKRARAVRATAEPGGEPVCQAATSGGRALRPAALGGRVARLPDLVILAGRQLGGGHGTELGRQGVPHLAVLAGEAIGVVGPLVLPGRTSCLRCLDYARAASDPSWPLILAQIEQRRPEPAACDTVLATAVAAQAA
ncbi:MAG TPA: hypothetical protein VF843_11080, partial [Streptosporangiaceae bacterium]